jgi:cell division protein FtsL
MMLSAKEAKRVRPGIFTGVMLVMGIVVIQLIQLTLNMILTQDAYYLRELKIEKRALSTEVQIIQEQVDSLASPQNLADAANRLGMVANPSSVLLDITNDKVYGAPKPAEYSQAPARANLVANAAMITTTVFAQTSVASADVAGSVANQNPIDTKVILVSGVIPASPTR